jgi:hypothetical protein
MKEITSFRKMSNHEEHRNLAVDGIKAGLPTLKKVEVIKERKLPTAEEILAARELAEKEPEAIPIELMPKTGDGRTHLDLIKEGSIQLKKVKNPVHDRLPTREQIEAERALLTPNL